MADIQLPQLPEATSAADTDILHIRAGSTDKFIDIANLRTSISDSFSETSASRNTVLGQEALSQGTAQRAGFSSTLFTESSPQEILTGVDMTTQWGTDPSERFGGFIFKKMRNEVESITVTSTVAGAGVELYTADTSAEGTSAAISVNGFTDEGFTIAQRPNGFSDFSQVAWSFQTTHRTSGTTNRNKPYTAHYNADMGFSVVGYEGDGQTGHERPHHLGAAPELSIHKSRDSGGAAFWLVTAPDLIGDQGYLRLDDATATIGTAATIIATDTTVSEEGLNLLETNLPENYISYHFRSIEGVSKVGKYIGTGVDGNYVDCGFGDKKAGWVMVKNITNPADWAIGDSARGANFQLKPNLNSVETLNLEAELVDGGFVLNSTHSDENALGDEYIFLAFADNSGTTGLTEYDYATSDDEITINNSTNLSFANGYDANGEINNLEQVGFGQTLQLGSGFENQKLYIFADNATTFGATEYKLIEGINRVQADKWGVESPNGVQARTTAKHFGYESATGVVSASGELYPAWQAFGKFGNTLAEANSMWGVSGTSGWLQYKTTEPRILKSWRLRASQTQGDLPRRFTIEGSNDGLNWSVIDSTYSTSDYVGNGSDLWGDLQDTSLNATDYIYHRVNITANSGSPSIVIAELELNTISPSDFYNVVEGVIYDSDDSPIQRVYLGECVTGALGEVANYKSYTPTPTKTVDGEYQGDLTVHGKLTTKEVGSFTDNGWCELPNGLILQWGNYAYNEGNNTTSSTTFPIAFPDVTMQVMISDTGGLQGDQGNTEGANIVEGSISTTGFSVNHQWSQGSSGTIRWFALGH